MKAEKQRRTRMEKTAKKSKKALKIVIIVLVVLAVVITAGLYALSVMIYNQFFGIRYETNELMAFSVSDFDGLRCEEHFFTSDKGQKLAGYLYTSNNDTYNDKIVVIAHGLGGGGHNSYMDVCNYFASNGFAVFAYDVTGNDNSEGESCYGLPQGVIDLRYAIDYVKSLDGSADSDILLLGHSWGGYSVTNVLTYHPDVKAVVSFAGFDKSTDLIYSQGKAMAGDAVDVVMPFLNIHEALTFGEYASNNASKAFEATQAKIMVLHSWDDNTVPIEYGYEIWYDKYRDNPRFTFVCFTDKGHSAIMQSEEAREYMKEFQAKGEAWKEALGYDTEAEENKERYKDDLANFYAENFDKQAYGYMLDYEIFDKVTEFYLEACGN